MPLVVAVLPLIVVVIIVVFIFRVMVMMMSIVVIVTVLSLIVVVVGIDVGASHRLENAAVSGRMSERVDEVQLVVQPGLNHEVIEMDLELVARDLENADHITAIIHDLVARGTHFYPATLNVIVALESGVIQNVLDFVVEVDLALVLVELQPGKTMSRRSMDIALHVFDVEDDVPDVPIRQHNWISLVLASVRAR